LNLDFQASQTKNFHQPTDSFTVTETR